MYPVGKEGRKEERANHCSIIDVHVHVYTYCTCTDVIITLYMYVGLYMLRSDYQPSQFVKVAGSHTFNN